MLVPMLGPGPGLGLKAFAISCQNLKVHIECYLCDGEVRFYFARLLLTEDVRPKRWVDRL